MSKTYQKKWFHKGGIIRQRDSTYQGEFTRQGNRLRKSFQSRIEAETWIDQKQVEYENLGVRVFALTESQRLDAVKAIALLKEIPLVTAAEFYLSYNRPSGGTRTLKAVYDDYLTRMNEKALRPDSIKFAIKTIGRLIPDFGERDIHTITSRELIGWMDANSITNATSKSIYIRYFRMLFNYALKQKFIASNPAMDIEFPRQDQKMPGIFALGDVERILITAANHEPRIVPYLAIGFFAGLRSLELARLDWKDIMLSEKLLLVRPEVSKTRTARHVTLSENLIAWIAPSLQSAGPVAPPDITRRRMIYKVIHKAGLRWVSNGMRHSFGSYHLAAHMDAARTAVEMGHTNATMLYRHYRALVKPDDARRYWEIYPQTSRGIIQLPVAAGA